MLTAPCSLLIGILIGIRMRILLPCAHLISARSFCLLLFSHRRLNPLVLVLRLVLVLCLALLRHALAVVALVALVGDGG